MMNWDRSDSVYISQEANYGMSLTGQATTGKKVETCKIVEKISPAWSNYRGFYKILGSLQYGPDKNLGT